MHRVDYLSENQLYLLARFLDQTTADQLMRQLTDEVTWEQPIIKLFGKQHPIPRLQAFQGDTDIHYRYSGKQFQTVAWHPAIETLLPCLEQETGAEFNCVLMNLYRTGQDSMGWHSDNEPELGDNPILASLSLGQQRRFLLRNRESGEKLELLLGHGDLLVMGDKLQHYWQHSVPRTRQQLAPRINLTFRKVWQR